jgi:hypothetical protein
MPLSPRKKPTKPTLNLRKFASGWLLPPRFAAAFVRMGRAFSLAVGSREPNSPLDEFMGEDWDFLRTALVEANTY